MIIIDYSECFGCGACAEEYPDVFEIRDEKAWVINSEIELDVIQKVVYVCPVRAMIIG